MDLLHSCAEERAGLQHVRRMHFNAAMLEVRRGLLARQRPGACCAAALSWRARAPGAPGAGGGTRATTEPPAPAPPQLHRRLHLLDTQRRQQQGEQMHELVRQQAAKLLVSGRPHPYKDEEEAAQEAAGAEGADADAEGGSRQALSSALAGFLDPEVQRQKQAKAAVLAIRKHLVAARHGRVSRQGAGRGARGGAALAAPGRGCSLAVPAASASVCSAGGPWPPRPPRPQVSHEDLGRANSAYVREAARSFIRGRGGDVLSGWGSPPGHVSALLCFDEVQVRAPCGAGTGAAPGRTSRCASPTPAHAHPRPQRRQPAPQPAHHSPPTPTAHHHSPPPPPTAHHRSPLLTTASPPLTATTNHLAR